MILELTNEVEKQEFVLGQQILQNQVNATVTSLLNALEILGLPNTFDSRIHLTENHPPPFQIPNIWTRLVK